MPQININRFDGGISDDPRQNTSNGFVISKHFDIYSYPHKLVPLRSTEADTNDGSSATGMQQYVIQDFVYASNGKFYGLGRKQASSHTKIFYKDSPITGNWTVPSSSESALTLVRGCFFEYDDYLWGFESTNKVFQYGVLSGTPIYSANATTLSQSITSTAQGLIGKDDQGYMFYNNVVVRVTNAAVVSEVLTLPTYLKITSATRYGNYLAIACAPKVQNGFSGKSIVYLWDYVSLDVQESIDWGDGQLMVLDVIEGILVGVTDKNMTVAIGTRPNTSMIVKMYTGTTKPVKEIFCVATNTSNYLRQAKTVKNDKLYFLASCSTSTDGTTFNEGIWVFGRKNGSDDFALTLEIIEEAATVNNAITGFGLAGDYFYIAFSTSGYITKTDDAVTYSFTSVYESQIFLTSKYKKKITGVWVTYEALPTAGQVVLKYRKDEETTYNPIFTDGTNSAVSHESVLIESTGAPLPTCKEIQFRIESTGGAVITGFGFNYDNMTGITK